MNRRFLLLIVFLGSATIGCGDTSGGSGDDTPSTASDNTLTVYAANSVLSASGSTTISVSGGSGSYVSASATEGTLTQSSTNTFIYTAASSPSTSYVTISITDSEGHYGTTYVSVGTSSTTSSTSCSGTYSATIGGIAASLYILQGSSNYISGFIYMYGYYYPLLGTCSMSTSSAGTISFTNVVDNSSYSGTVSVSSSLLYISGSMTAASSGTTHSWTATSQTAVTTQTVPASSCQGNYSAVIGANSGTLVLVNDGNFKVAGYLYLQGYVYAIAGTCNAGTGAVSLKNYTTGSIYSGTVSTNGTTRYMSGTFALTSGTTYNWSATSQ